MHESGISQDRLTYLVDFDSTINMFEDHFIRSLARRFGPEFQMPDMSHWDWVRSMPEEQVKYIWGSEAFDNMTWNLAIPPEPGAIYAVRRMIDSGNRVIVLSSRPLHHAQWLRDWLDDKGLTQAESWVTAMKLEFAQEYGVNLAFDDSPHHAVSLATHCPVYLMDRPWNQEVNGENITRVPSLWCAVEDMGID